MLITETLQGTPYQSYVPKPLRPKHSRQVISAFKDIDTILKQNLNADSFESLLPSTIGQHGSRSAFAERHLGVHAAISAVSTSQFISSKNLIAINSAVLGRASGYRMGPGWIGGPHPSVSWHVGAPADRLHSLVNGILCLNNKKEPVSYIAIISLMRLLQVHPFKDGNGRTARAYACWLIKKSIGPSPQFCTIINSIWCRSSFDLHAASLAIKAGEDWGILFDHVFESLEKD